MIQRLKKYNHYNTTPFEQYTEEYEQWFENNKFAYQSEIEAIRDQMPELGRGIEVGIGIGKYAIPLNIKEGVDPSEKLCEIARAKNLDAMTAPAEDLPYGDLRFDFVVMVFSVSYFKNVAAAMKEAYRVLKNDGSLIVGFIEKDSTIGQSYQNKKHSKFYKNAIFYSVESLTDHIRKAGFKNLSYTQTLFGELESIKEFQPAKDGYGQGSFVVVKAIK